MHLRTWLRIGLLAVILAAVGAIIWNLASRRQLSVTPGAESLLPADITRRSTEFEFLQRKEGKVVFKVQATTSVMNQEGEHTLKEVSLVHFDSQGNATDAVDGREATYHVFQKQVEFREDVTIHLADGTNIFSNRVQIDLNKETVRIARSFRFRMGSLGGTGESLLYEIPQKRLHVGGSFHLEAPAGPNRIHVRSDSALYLPRSGRLELRKNSSIVAPDHRLAASRIDLFLNRERRVQRIESRGDAVLAVEESRRFWGNSIFFYFQPQQASLEYFEVLGGNSEQALVFRPAVYEESRHQGTHRMEAVRIQGTVLKDQSNEVHLQEIHAKGAVLLRSSVLGIEDSHAESVRAYFSPETDGMENVILEQEVSLLRRLKSSSPTSQERLRADHLELNLTPLQVLESATARGNVTVETGMNGGFRSLSAQEQIAVDFQQGVVQKLSAVGDCLLKINRPGERNSLRAPLIEVRFEKGLIKKLEAFEGVEMELQQTQASSLHTRSRQLEGLYQNGNLLQLIQSGDFHLRERSVDGVTSLAADRGVYQARSMQLTATGRQNPVLQYSSGGFQGTGGEESETIAEQIVLDRGQKLVLGRGNVRSVVRQNSGPVVVTAGEMKADLTSGWVEYRQSPRLVQGDNLVTGNWIRLDNRNQGLQVEGDVKSFVIEQREDSLVRYEVQSDTLTFRREEKVAEYRGNVRLNTGDVRMEAPAVDVHFVTQSLAEVTRLVGSGGVLIIDGGKRARGRQVVYLPAEDRYTVTN